MTRPFSIVLAGLGTVGGAFVKRLASREDSAPALKLVAVSARDRKKRRALPLEGVAWAEDAETLLRHDADAVVELIGGAEGAARNLVEAALAKGTPVITANKALLARHGAALAALAEENDAPLLYEAAIAAALPAVRVSRDSLSAEPVARVFGILNGTCNHILTAMAGGRPFDEALKDAQRQGYAEADPSLDIDGHDAAQKLTLLSALCFGVAPSEAAVETEGIRDLIQMDMRLAEGFGYAIRLVADASAAGGGRGIRQCVRPRLLPLGHRLAKAEGAINALIISGRHIGDLLLEGEGAGASPTAAAVLSDAAALARGDARLPVFSRPAETLREASAASSEKEAFQEAFYVRVFARDEPGSAAKITRIFAEEGVSLARITQTDEIRDKKRSGGVARLPVAVITHAAERAAIERIRARLKEASPIAISVETESAESV